MNKPNNTPPPWSEAPPWAEYRAQDENGAWFAYESKPEIRRENWSSGFGFWGVTFGQNKLLKWSDPNPDWKTTLQKRPENE